MKRFSLPYSASLFPFLPLLGLVTCLLSCSKLHAQTSALEKMEVEVILADSSQKTPMLLQLANGFRDADPEKSLRYARQAYRQALAAQEPQTQAQALYALGKTLEVKLADYDSALATYLMVVRNYPTADRNTLSETRMAIASTYRQVGNYSRALEFLLQVELNLKARSATGELLARCQMEIGDLYRVLQQYPSALTYLQQAQAGFMEVEGWRGAAKSYHLMGELYRAMGQSDNALQQHLKALDLLQRQGIEEDQAGSFLYLGEYYLEHEQPSKAAQALSNALRLSKYFNQSRERAQTHAYQARLALQAKNPEAALKELGEGLDYALNVGDQKMLASYYEMLFNANASLGQVTEAQRYKDLFIAFNEFVYKEQNERTLSEMQARFEIEQKEQEIASLQQEARIKDLTITQQTNQRNFLFIATLLVLCIAGILLYFGIRIRRSNSRLSRINAQIKAQKADLEELNGTKDKFFSIIAHDLKGPLASLRSFSGLLINHTDHLSKEEIESLATDLDGSLKNLFSLLENLLTWARSQTGRLTYEPQPWPLRKVVAETLGVLEPSAQKKSITLKNEVPEDAIAFGDRNMITTVIRNLVANALKFSNEGGQVVVGAAGWADAFEVMVQDSGVGMEPAIKEKLFKVGEKVTTKGTANEKGTGLGLILCRDFVEKNGGTIWVESEKDQGTTFRFTVPKATEAAPTEA